jgi:hypothetical protein
MPGAAWSREWDEQVGSGRGRFRALLASTSVSALLIGGGAPSTLAAAC